MVSRLPWRPNAPGEGMRLHTEINFESEICAHLAAHGWLYSADDAGYDRDLALYPPDLFDWLEEAQPKAWEKFAGTPAAQAQLVRRLAAELDSHGPLHVLRNGFKFVPAGLLDLWTPCSTAWTITRTWPASSWEIRVSSSASTR